MEYLNFNETFQFSPGTNSLSADIISLDVKKLQDGATNASNTSYQQANSSLEDEVVNLPGLNDKNTRRLVGIFFLILCTIAGNITLIVALTYKRSRRIKRVNVFLVNLAISDLAVAFITMTTEILFIAFGEWVLGPVICKISVYLEIVTLAAATFLLTAMSIDRYQVIVKPLESLTNRPKIWTKVMVAWGLAFVFATPQILNFLEVTVYDEKEGKTKHFCESKGYQAEWQRKLYFTFLTCYILIIPAIIMTFCYLKIMKVIWSRSENGRSSGKHGDHTISPRMSINRNLVSSSRRKVVILTLTVIIGFLVCLTPYFVVSLVRIYSSYRIKLSEYLPAAEMIFMLHSALNPILFGIFTLRLEHLSCLLHKSCKTCFFDGLKDSATNSNFKKYKGNDVKMRLMSSAVKQQRDVIMLQSLKARNEDKILRKDDCQLSGEEGKLLVYRPVLDADVIMDAKPNGHMSVQLKSKKVADDGKTHNEVTDKVSADDSGLISSSNYPSLNTKSICNSASRELTEYVSCV